MATEEDYPDHDEKRDGPLLFDTDGEKIEVHRNGAQFFSNHPQYDVMLQLRNAGRAKPVGRPAVQDAEVPDDEVVETSDVNGDGKLGYDEMTAKDLAAELHRREIPRPSPANRQTLTAALRADDQEKAAQGG